VCTIVVIHKLHPELPLVIGANRDEMYARASTSPHVLVDRPRIVGGQDVERGGTWLGVSETGLVVAITNQRTYFPADRSLASRGEVVLEALRHGSVDEVDAFVRRLDPAAYNPFNLLYGDIRAMHVAYVRHAPPSIEIESLEPGLHVLTNDRIGSPEFPKAERAAELVRPFVRAPWPELRSALERTLADHALPDISRVTRPPPDSPMDLDFAVRLQAICTHTPQYGTHSSTILALGPNGVEHYLFAAGAPSDVPFENVLHGG
jgi:uncharacterized protein with NRDE domain